MVVHYHIIQVFQQYFMFIIKLLKVRKISVVCYSYRAFSYISHAIQKRTNFSILLVKIWNFQQRVTNIILLTQRHVSAH
jgi:hypothetical protein